MVYGLQEGIVFSLIACDFDGVALLGHIDDAATEDIGHALHLFTLFADGTHFDHHQLALDVSAFAQIDNFDDFH